MARSRSLTIAAAALLSFTFSAAPILAQSAQSNSTWSQDDTVRIIKDVQKKIGGLTNYAVFDWITFGIHGKTLVLNGYASRPTLKDEAGRVVKGIPGIASVENNIEVLPYSPNDDRVRAAVYNRIYTAPSLRRYNANQGSLGRAIGPGAGIALAAGGITNSPPLGYHAIHIIVKNGNVILYGVVSNQSDAAIAGMQANSAPGSFGITNNIVVEGAPAKNK
ncbi:MULTISPECIES: BON domain-containing protein [Acidobacteriaceae]|uniref:BON domain-containing protein n=1 Tax=Acidobacteriaceae TaxID=204434 RepID=UPI00131C2A9A|nr:MULTISPECIES: BON domain-containing protein [Acidobacteriaceae]MDW5264628.1 BON domain-containing protein [Edaphobacter sp.]